MHCIRGRNHSVSGTSTGGNRGNSIKPKGVQRREAVREERYISWLHMSKSSDKI